MRWQGGRLIIEVNEMSSPPLISKVRGTITLTPSAVTDIEVPLAPDGSHIWRPFAPTATIEVDLTQGHQWRGHGYFDANFGTAALEDDFRSWTWGRYPLSGGAACFYDAVRADGSRLALGLKIAADGRAREIAPPPEAGFSRTLWGLARTTRADPGHRPRQVMALLDAPFYSRSIVSTRIGGEASTGVHEALDLRRFASPLLKPMLAVRVPRRAGWRFD